MHNCTTDIFIYKIYVFNIKIFGIRKRKGDGSKGRKYVVLMYAPVFGQRRSVAPIGKRKGRAEAEKMNRNTRTHTEYMNS